MSEPSDVDRAYTAGIIDGEGSISLILNTSRRTGTGRPATAPMLVLQVSMTDEALIRWLATTWGVGQVNVTYRPEPGREHHRHAFGWRVRGAAAAAVLESVLPFLRVKAEQARLGISSRDGVMPSRKLGDVEMARRMALRDQMIELNGTRSRVGKVGRRRKEAS